LPRYRLEPVSVARSDMTRGRAGEEVIRVAAVYMLPVCLSVGRYRFINYRGGCGMSDSPAVDRHDRGRVTCQPASMTCRIYARALQRRGKERNFDVQYKKYNTNYASTNMNLFNTTVGRDSCTKCVLCGVHVVYVTYIFLCPADLWPGSAVG